MNQKHYTGQAPEEKGKWNASQNHPLLHPLFLVQDEPVSLIFSPRDRKTSSLSKNF